MKYLYGFAICLVMISCGRKMYLNRNGFERPVKKGIFNYRKRFTGVPQQIDLNAIYVHHCQYQTTGGIRLQYAYFRFFSGGQVLYAGSDSIQDLSHVNDLDWGIAGRYYFKKNRLRLQLFDRVSLNLGRIYKFHGFIQHDSLFIYYTSSSPDPWCQSPLPRLPRNFEKKEVFRWEKQTMTFKATQPPNW
jgi:hypothetical protein